MSAHISISNKFAVTDLPPPDATGDISANTDVNPACTMPKVTDSGRIRFGAGYRLPASK